MGRQAALLDIILPGSSDRSIRFDELRSLLRWLGFRERIRGSHHLFIREGISELLNLQRDGDKAKAYQVRQLRRILTKYGAGELPPEG